MWGDECSSTVQNSGQDEQSSLLEVEVAKQAQGLPELEMMFLHAVEPERETGRESCQGQAEGGLDHSDVGLGWQTLDALDLQPRMQFRLPKHLRQRVCYVPASHWGGRELSFPQVLPVCKLVAEKPTRAFAENPVQVRLVRSPFLIALMASPPAPEVWVHGQQAAATSLGLGLDR